MRQKGLHNYGGGTHGETDCERDECPECGEGVMPAEEIANGICTTQSINSPVIVDEEGTTEGHIMLLDYDEKNAPTTCETIDNLPGISIVLESSENSSHVWNLTVREVEKTVTEMVMLRNELAHIRSGLNRGYWRLRIGPKVRDGGDLYKSPPELKSVVVNETSKTQSSPHWKLCKSMYDIPALPDTKRFNWTGTEFSTERYATLTDEAKEAWPDA